MDLNGPDPVTRVSRNRKKLVIQAIFGRFRGLKHIVLGSRVDLNGLGPRNTSFTKSEKPRDFGHFWPFSWAIAHGFGVRGGFKLSGTP